MIFPIVLKTPAYVEPVAAIHFLVAANGVFQVTETPGYRAVTRVADDIPGLVPEYEHLRLRVPPLARAQVEDVVAFFAEAYRRYRAEAVVLLFFSFPTREFRVVPPPQVLTGRIRGGRWEADHAVDYGEVPCPEGFVRFGTIHSHAELPAYASHVDCDDERYGDGLHIVFGSFHQADLTVTASFVASGVRFVLDATEVLEPYDRPAHGARPEWMARLALVAARDGKHGKREEAYPYADTKPSRLPSA